MGFFVQLGDEGAGSNKSGVVVIDAEEQEKAVAGLRCVGARQRWVVVFTPRVEAEQDGTIRVEDLTEVVVSRSCLRLAEK